MIELDAIHGRVAPHCIPAPTLEYMDWLAVNKPYFRQHGKQKPSQKGKATQKRKQLEQKRKRWTSDEKKAKGWLFDDEVGKAYRVCEMVECDGKVYWGDRGMKLTPKKCEPCRVNEVQQKLFCR